MDNHTLAKKKTHFYIKKNLQNSTCVALCLIISINPDILFFDSEQYLNT